MLPRFSAKQNFGGCACTTSTTTAFHNSIIGRFVVYQDPLEIWDVEAEAGSGPFSVEAEARKFYRFRFHIGYLTWRVTWRKILSISQCRLNGEVAL